MSLTSYSCDTFVPTKRSAPSDFEPLRVSRSMTADDPYSRNLLIDHPSPPPMAASSRRRVNPESLAVRLGPELVKELESYVKPGVVEMPSFAIRQQIQMRHKVDRRHIYDWFHSKGLRVTKEDKRATVEQKTDAMRMQRRIRRCIAPAVPSVKACPSLSGSVTDSAPPSPALLTPPVIPSEFRPALTPTHAPWLPSFDQHGIVGQKREASHTAGPTTWGSSAPVREPPCAGRVLTKMNSSLNLPPRPPAGYTRKLRDSRIDSIFVVDEAAVLDQTKREACYDTLSRVLGPADGVQECVGTYRAHMAKRLEIYYEDFLLSNLSPPSGDTVEASTWSPVQRDSWSASMDVPSESSTHLWGALDSILDWASCNQVSPSASTSLCESTNWIDNSDTSSVDCLSLEDILAAPVLEQERPKAVTFASFSELFPSQPVSHFFGSSSSSLAGALGEPPSSSIQQEQDVRRRSKEWVRPRMGRPRAYSSGGGM